MNPTLIYCYDAYCGWCYGFSPVISKIAAEYRSRLPCEVLSGGMILPGTPSHISVTAGYILNAYKTVEDRTGIKFGEDYLWHIKNPDQSDWYPNSEKPAVAMCVFKEYYTDRQSEFASALQYALHFEGRDLTDNEAYRHLIAQYDLPEDEFYLKLSAKEYAEKARLEFALVKQLKVSGFPTVFIQASDTQFYVVARGYTDYDLLKGNIESVLHSITRSSPSS